MFQPPYRASMTRLGTESQQRALRSTCARPTWAVLMVTASLVLGAMLASAPVAEADTFCDLSPTSDGIGIDFGQPFAAVRSSAAGQVVVMQQVLKLIPADAPNYVRVLFAGDLAIAKQTIKVASAAQAKRLARQSVAVVSSVSGRAAVKWLEGRCRVPDTIDVVTIGPDTKVAKSTTPTTARPNPARASTPPGSGPATAFDPCAIIPSQLAATVLGAGPGNGDSTATMNGGQCSYGTDGGGLIVTTVIGMSALGKTAKEAVMNANASALASKARDTKGEVIYDTLPGIGDGAFVIGSGASADKAFTSASLTFYTGDTWVSILLSYHPATRNPVTEIILLARSVAPLVPR